MSRLLPQPTSKPQPKEPMDAENTGATHLRRGADARPPVCGRARRTGSVEELFFRQRHAFDGLRQQPLFALDLFVFDLLAVLEGAEAFAVNAGVVDEHVFPLWVND